MIWNRAFPGRSPASQTQHQCRIDGIPFKEGATVDQLPHQQEQPQDGRDPDTADSWAGTEITDRAPFATRVRVILLLSLICWGFVVLAIAWLAGWL